MHLAMSAASIVITVTTTASQPFYQVLDDIYSKIVEPLRADVYVVSSDERWVCCPLHLPYRNTPAASVFSRQ